MKAERLLRLGIACQDDFELLRKCLQATDAKRVVMIGSGLGVLSAVVLEYSQAWLLSIDSDRYNLERDNLEAVGLWKPERIWQVIADSSTFGLSICLMSDFDVIVVDGGHDYEQVKADIEAWSWQLRRPGGIMFFHDYDAKDAPLHHPGVKQAVDESEVATWPIFGRQGWSIAFQRPT